MHNISLSPGQQNVQKEDFSEKLVNDVCNLDIFSWWASAVWNINSNSQMESIENVSTTNAKFSEKILLNFFDVCPCNEFIIIRWHTDNGIKKSASHQ